MNLFWRTLWTILFSRFDAKVGLMDACRTSFYVLPTDVDILFHLNNGRYLSIMDLARTNQMIRCGYLKKFNDHAIYPVIASETIRFKKSINLFKRFDIITKIIGWDDKFIYVSQVFIRKNSICALSIVKVCFLSKKTTKRLTTAEFTSLINLKQSSPVLPQWIHDWTLSDQQYHDKITKLFISESG